MAFTVVAADTSAVKLDHCSTRASSAVMFTHRNWALTELKAIVDKWQSFMKTNDG
ncbi:hypothetical protein POJ06DRAFT_255657 [Lipomyces tetrasporus]|uniref:Uncharacterized protein n=1 Tax=Lipomyces tetrasporus TaxID=54092 RepID=A0AAD7QPG9_9ASCO|nr:uncharacterized protein POJ06DRAFT_255657 [Lipomyces tetrasporus]KAJ8098984.1 hypothetical protein POJ06DRAFT_255657 [Lipomyces tetrasporus]